MDGADRIGQQSPGVDCIQLLFRNPAWPGAGSCSRQKWWLNTHPSPPIQWEVIIFQGMSHWDCCPLLGCCVQEFNAAAGIETFDIKWVFTKALGTHFYCQTNVLTMLMLCGVPFSKCLYSFYSWISCMFCFVVFYYGLYCTAGKDCIKTIFG